VKEDQPIQLLLIDDEPSIGDFTLRFLRKKFPSISIHQLTHCVDALQELAAKPGLYDVVLIDERLIGSRGLDCLRSIREMWPTLPAIILTGYDGDDIREECMEAGADDFVLKSGIKDLLPHVIWSAMERRKSAIIIGAEVERRRRDVVPDLRKLTEHIQSSTGDLGEIRTRLVLMETSIRKFERIITDGNGQPSVLQQLTSVQANLFNLTESIRGLRRDDADDKRTKRQATAAVICAILSAAAAVIVAVLKK
jgi:DNA-binding NarL/FixJ family response regulator